MLNKFSLIEFYQKFKFLKLVPFELTFHSQHSQVILTWLSHFFSYNAKTAARLAVFDFNFNHQMLTLIQTGYKYGPSISKQIIRNTFVIV